jgi:hypothetical protein
MQREQLKYEKANVNIILKRAQDVGAMNFACARHRNAAGWITGPSEWGASCRPVGHSARGVQQTTQIATLSLRPSCRSRAHTVPFTGTTECRSVITKGISEIRTISIFREKVLTAVVMKVAIFWHIATCSSYVNRRFGETYHLQLRGSFFGAEDGGDKFR